MLRVAMLSAWHVHAKGYAHFLSKQEDVQITCVWDEEPDRGRAWAAELGAAFVDDVDALLARDDVDAVVIDSPTNMHTELMVKAAGAKKHIFTEKAMALTTAECDRIIEAIRANDVVFTISFPWRTMPLFQFMQHAIASGLIGDVTVLRIRNAHDGSLRNWLPLYWYDPETTGGGAMMDLGCHGLYMARELLGKPSRVTSMFNNITDRPVDDNAVSLVEFENKAIAILETALVSPLSPGSLELYGTKGVVLVRDDKVVYRTTDTARDSNTWLDARLPEALPQPLRGWIDSILYGKPNPFTYEDGRNLTELMEAAYRSHREHREIAL